MRVDVWRRLSERFAAGVLEFYASTEVSFVLANAAGEKVGSVGRPLPGSRDSLLAAYDLVRGDFVRDRRGRMVPARPNQPGVLLVRVDPTPRAPHDESATLRVHSAAVPRIVRGVLGEDDRWFVTGDLLKKDDDGDFWFLDRLVDLIRTKDGLIPGRPIEDVLDEAPEVRRCAAYGVQSAGEYDLLCVAVATRPKATLTASAVRDRLRKAGMLVTPAVVRFVEELPMTDGFRVLKDALRKEGIPAGSFRHVAASDAYELVSVKSPPRVPSSAG
jgi:putative long chain acyl-CoA synthase